MHKFTPMIALVLILLLAGLACNLPASNKATPTGPQGTFTALARTLDVLLTQTAVAGGQVTVITPMPGTGSATVTNTLMPSATNRPTNTPVPPTPVPCNSATFLQDVTIPDGTQMAPGQAFTKTWRLLNSGSCTWSTSYTLVFDSGTAMGAPSTVNLPGSVPPGQTIDLSVSLTAPSAPGTFRGNFRLRDGGGATFGIGPNNNIAFWAEIKVVGPTTTLTPTVTLTPTPTNTTSPGTTLVYDLAANYCMATWVTTTTGQLPCPGTSGATEGFILKLDNPNLQNGSAAGEAAVELHPMTSDNASISGTYPAITANSGYHFKSRISCLKDSTGCNVKYQLNYHLDGGASVANLGQWTLTYSDSVQTLDVDLSSLAGHTVQLVLAVQANGSAAQANALWVAPKVVK